MPTLMVVHMTIDDPSWMKEYFLAVPSIYAEYGGRSLAWSHNIRRIEGNAAPPERIAIFEFPSSEALDRFMADPRYEPFREARRAGSRSEIYAFDGAL